MNQLLTQLYSGWKCNMVCTVQTASIGTCIQVYGFIFILLYLTSAKWMISWSSGKRSEDNLKLLFSWSYKSFIPKQQNCWTVSSNCSTYFVTFQSTGSRRVLLYWNFVKKPYRFVNFPLSFKRTLELLSFSYISF